MIDNGSYGIVFWGDFTLTNISFQQKCFLNFKNNPPYPHIDGLVQERRNSIANALELRLSCNKPSVCQ